MKRTTWEHRSQIRMPLFDRPTSSAAAERIAPHARGLRAVALRAFVDAGPSGLTDAEAIARTGIAGDSWRPRRCELVKSGAVVRTDRTRPTPGGNQAHVYVARQYAMIGAGVTR